MDLGLGVLLEARDLFSGTFQRAGMSFRDFEGSTSAAGRRITDNLKTLGTGLSIFAAGALGLASLRAPLVAATDYGAKIAEIRTIVDEATFSTSALEDATFELAAIYGGGPIGQAGALYETISAGVMDAVGAVDLLAVSNEFAVGGNAELKAGVDVLTSAVNTYADVSLSARDASDALFVAIAAGKTTAAELSHSMGEVAPTAHAMGVSFDELTAAIAAMTVQGVKTPQAVTSLNAMLANIAKPSKDAAEEAKRLGIEFGATALKSKGFAGFLAQLQGNTKITDDSFAKLFGSIDGIKGAFTLTSNNGAKLAEVLAQMENKSGATKKAFDIMAETTAFQEKRFASLKESAKVLIGQALEPMAAKVLGFANRLVEAFLSIPAPMRTFLVRAFAVASAVTAIVGAAIAAKAAIGIVSAGLAAAGVTAAGFIATVAPVIVVLGAAALAFSLFRTAYEQNIGGFAAFVDGIASKVRLAVSALGQAFSEGGFSGAVRDELNRAENQGVKNFVLRLFVTVERIREFFSALSESFGQAIANARPHFDAFMSAIDRLADTFGGLFAAIDPEQASADFDSFTSAGARTGEVLGKVAVAIVDALTAAIDVVAGFGSAWDAVSTGVSEVTAELDPLFADLRQLGVELGIIDADLSATGDGWFAFGASIAAVLGSVLSIARAVFSGVIGQVRGFAHILGGVIEVVQGLIEGDWAKVWAGAKRIIYGALTAAMSLVGALVETVAAAIDALGKLVGSDFGFQAKVASFRGTVDSFLRDSLDVDDRTVARPAKGATLVGAGAAGGGEPALPATAFVPPPGVNPDELFATIAAANKASSPPAVNASFSAKLFIDGEELASRVESASVSRADRSFTPGVPILP